MNNVVFVAVIAAAFLANPFHALAQEPTTSPRQDVIAPPVNLIQPADPSIGKWVGVWQSSSRSWINGSMEMEVDVNGNQVTGQVKVKCSDADLIESVKLIGVRKGEKVFAQYHLSGRCGKVDIIYAIDREGRVMTGTWSSEYPGYGTFRLTK